MNDKVLDLVIKVEPGGMSGGETVLLVIAIVLIFAAVVGFIMRRK